MSGSIRPEDRIEGTMLLTQRYKRIRQGRSCRPANDMLKKSFIFVISFVWVLGEAGAAVEADGFVPPYYTWSSESMPVLYYVNGEDADAWPEGAGAIIRSFMSWERIPGAHVRFQYAGTTDKKTAQDDGRNIVTWVREGWPYGRDTVAYAVLWVSRNNRRIIGVDILLNAEDFLWASDGDPGAMDVQDVTTHEIGHALGLEHSVTSTSVTMFPVIMPGEVRKRTIHDEEQWVLRSIYPIGRTQVETYAFSGAVRDIAVEETVSGYPPAQGGGGIFLLTRVDEDGEDGLDEVATIEEENGKLAFYLFPSISADAPAGVPIAYDVWSIPEGSSPVDLTALDIDGDGREEIGVLRASSDGNYTLHIYDTPAPFSVTEDDSRPWVWRQAFRPTRGDTLVSVIGMDYEGDAIDELAIVRLTPDGLYFLDVYYVGRSDSEPQRIASISLPGIAGFTDLDMSDLDGDGQSELVVLFADPRGAYLSILEVPDAPSPTGVLQTNLVATVPLSFPAGRRPLRVSSLRVGGPDGSRRSAFCILTAETF